MANELKYVDVVTGLVVKAKVYSPAGVRRENPDVTLTEIGTTGIYVGSSANIVAGDIVSVYNNADATKNIGSGEYKPEVSASGIEAKIDTIDTNIDSLTTSVASVLTAQQQVHSNLGGEDLTNVKIVSNL